MNNTANQEILSRPDPQGPGKQNQMEADEPGSDDSKDKQGQPGQQQQQQHQDDGQRKDRQKPGTGGKDEPDRDSRR
ncbi:hypothetical protein [[Pseudomonas] boreopolis]|uniref:Uncharacterized protein n=1 Tax=Xanthomonas boreopolis TaxID=86183 RepID=A0A919F769_9XANT|nr:hypothetical protein GCM10009090_15710 [[Pseudomonas] boreopolis]